MENIEKELCGDQFSDFNDFLMYYSKNYRKICCHESKSNIYFHCIECCKSHMVYCSKCFIPEDHKGHRVLFSYDAYCDCGGEIEIKSCKIHPVLILKKAIPLMKRHGTNFSKYLKEYPYLFNHVNQPKN